MRASNAYCQHRNADARRCPHRATAKDRFGVWACPRHLEMVEQAVREAAERRRKGPPK